MKLLTSTLHFYFLIYSDNHSDIICSMLHRAIPRKGVGNTVEKKQVFSQENTSGELR